MWLQALSLERIATPSSNHCIVDNFKPNNNNNCSGCSGCGRAWDAVDLGSSERSVVY